MPSAKEFYREVHRRALKEARRILHVDAGTSLLAVVVLFVAYVLLVWRFVGPTEATTEIQNRILAIAAPLTCALFVYLVRRRTAAPELIAEAEEAAARREDQLKTQLSDAEARLSAVALVGQLAYQNLGVVLERVANPAEGAVPYGGGVDLIRANVTGVEIFFENLSDKLLSYRIATLEAWVNDRPVELVAPQQAAAFVHAGQSLRYSAMLRMPAPVSTPFAVTVNARLHKGPEGAGD